LSKLPRLALEAGMEMLKQIQELAPEQQKELQTMYMALEDITNSGMNKIAESLSTSTSFATAELTEMYYNAQTEIASALAAVNSDLTINLANAQS
jgi:uncharacterized protein YjgD (DUF1641 family)